jgi:putative addiction module CopG family antidote
MIKKSISVTEQQNDWIKAQISTGHYGNDSEVIRELIRERQLREQESNGEIARIRQRKSGLPMILPKTFWQTLKKKCVWMASYKLSKEAKSDLKKIYRYGVVNFGEKQADKYFHAFFIRF